jgi:YidC/Oxa1 family membrane protein insertase
MSSQSVFLGVFAGITQFIQGYLSSPINTKKAEIIVDKQSINEPKTFQEQMADSMQLNVRYILPIFVGFIAWKISAAVALYWIVSNIFTITQEWYIRRKLKFNVI